MPSQADLHDQVQKLHEKVDHLTRTVEGLLHELLERTKHLGHGGPGDGTPPTGSAY